MWITFLGKHIKPSLAEIVLALIPSRICIYQFCNRLDSLTLCNTRTVTFKLVTVKNRCSWFTQLYIHASYSYSLLVFVNCCAFIHQSLYVIIRQLFYSLFDYFFSSSFEFCFDCCSKEKEQFWTWTLFRYFDPAIRQVPALPVTSNLRLFQHHHLESINIIQQTPPTLS